VAALASSVAVIAYWNFESVPRLRKRAPAYRALVAATLGYGVVALPGLWALHGTRLGVELATAALVCVLALVSHLVLRRILQPAAGSVGSLRLLALSVLLATLVALPIHLWTLGIEPWRAAG